MRTVTYLTDRTHPLSAGGGKIRDALLSRLRSRWQGASDLPLVRIVTLYHPDLPPAFEGVRVVQISDVHAGTFMPPERLARVRELAESLEPELVLFTGDQLDRRDVDADLFVHGFAGVDAPLGVFGVLGNHDHLAGAELAEGALLAVGITPLVNEAAFVQRDGATLLLAGVDDLDAGPGRGPDFSVLQRPADFRLLLCHQPNGWPRGRAWGADITFAGHTHGGQISGPKGKLNLARLHTPFVAGAYTRNDSLLYVSRGVGVGAVPVRYCSPPEIELITLRRGFVSAAG
jgi:predicted MPP superfamily phosphohydrolase